ncbi:MAG: hypothetical protein WD448_11140 [Woeseia sp.]
MAKVTVTSVGMAELSRCLVPQVRRDLAKKMVFVAGPRQVGKTTLARGLPGAAAGYLNWDVAEASRENSQGRAAARAPVGLR